jgi:hypothetical protein
MSRLKGSQNERVRRGRELALSLVEDPIYLAGLKSRFQAGAAPHMEKHIWELAYGKPVQAIQVENIEPRDMSHMTYEELLERSAFVNASLSEIVEERRKIDAVSAIDKVAEDHDLGPIPSVPFAEQSHRTH